MAVGEGGKRRGRREVPRLDIVVKRPEALLEGVREALVVAAGVVGEPPGLVAEQRGIADQALVGLVAMADPHLVGLLAAPGEGLIRAGDLVPQAVLPPRRHLRDPQTAPGPARKAQQDAAIVLRGDIDRFGLDGGLLLLALEGLHLAQGPLPHRMHGRKIGTDGLDLQPRNRMDQVQPVRPDIGDGPQLAALLGQHPPVVVGRVEQPILHVAAADGEDTAQSRRVSSCRPPRC